MFTGIVEEVGTIRNIKRGQHSAVLTIHAKTVLEGTRIGDSIAVNGICLTVTRLFPDGFSADVMHETLNRSSLAGLTAGSVVNLERAMPANGRFGGHIVAGHVDGVGHIANIRRDDTAVWYTVHAGPEILRYVVEKGSITIDGISLTVAAVDGEDWDVPDVLDRPENLRADNLYSGRLGNVGLLALWGVSWEQRVALPGEEPEDDLAEFLRCELAMTDADSGLRTDDIFNVRTGEPVPPEEHS